MNLALFKYVLPIGVGFFFCSCAFQHSDEEYRNFVRSEVEKIRKEQILLEKQKQENQRVQIALQEQKKQLEKESHLLFQEKELIAKEGIALLKLKKELENKKNEKPNYENVSCRTQEDCGGINSGYFCNANGFHTPDRCEKTKPEKITQNGEDFYYNSLSDLKSWCREAFESQADRDSPGNCNWGYLSYNAAESWCASIGKKLVKSDKISQNCDQFSFLPQVNPDQQYWTQNLKVVHMGQKCSIQNMVRGDGYAWAGGVICQ